MHASLGVSQARYRLPRHDHSHTRQAVNEPARHATAAAVSPCQMVVSGTRNNLIHPPRAMGGKRPRGVLPPPEAGALLDPS